MLDTLIISDVHLGSATCLAVELLDCLKRLSYKRLIILGDMFADLDFGRLNKAHWNVLSYIREISNLKHGIEVVWVIGNHDEKLSLVLSHLVGIETYDKYEWMAGSLRCVAIHGHQFDPSMKFKWATDKARKRILTELNIFEKRTTFKPFTYPDVEGYKRSIQHSYWLVSEFNFTADVQDFHVRLNDTERQAIKRALLAISQIEISVKRFWTKLGDRFPKAEFEQVGVVFGESEVRHADAYSHLLQVLGLNDDFAMLLQEPVIQGRVDYLTKYLKGAASTSNEAYTLTLTLFALFIENVSLFSQFLVIKSFSRSRNLLKDVDNVVQATQKEEQIHAMFGAYLINLVKQENPEWFDAIFYAKIERACRRAYEAEERIIDWMFEAGELSFLSKREVSEFIKDRFNQSLQMIGAKAVFPVDMDYLRHLKWFDDELATETAIDFFQKKSTAYAKRTQSITSEDLF